MTFHDNMSARDKMYRMTGVCVAAVAAIALFQDGAARAEPLGYAAQFQHPSLLFGQTLREQEPVDDIETPDETPARMHRHVVDYATRESPGTIIIDTPNT